MTEDLINQPPHYIKGGYEVYDVAKAFFEGQPHEHELRTAAKYLFRAPFKGSMVEDLKEMIWYATKVIDGMESVVSNIAAANEALIPDSYRVWHEVADIPEGVLVFDEDGDFFVVENGGVYRTNRNGLIQHQSWVYDHDEYAPYTEVLSA